MKDEILFWKYDWNRLVEAKKVTAQKEADNVRLSDFDRSQLDQLTSDICMKHSLSVPKLDLKSITVRQHEVNIDVGRDRMRSFTSDGPHFVKGTAIDVRIPFTGEPEMFKVKPNTWTTSVPRGRIEGSTLVFTISGVSLSKDEVKSQIDHQIEQLNTWLNFQVQSIGNFETELSLVVRQTLENRKRKLDGDVSLIAGLGYKTE